MGGGGGAAFDATSITGAPAAASLALADLFPVAQSGVLAKATIQQALDAGGLLAADSSPTDADKFLVNQGGVAKTLLLSVARAQLDAFGATRNIQATQLSLAAGTALQLPTIVQLGGTSASFPALKRNAADVNFRLADDSDYAGLRAVRIFGQDGGTDRMLVAGDGSSISIYLSSASDIRFGNGASWQNPDSGLKRAAAGVIKPTDGGSGFGQIRHSTSTGVGMPLLGANCPAATLAAPYGWGTCQAGDGTPCVFPMYQL